MSHYNNIFNKKNVEYSLVNVGDRLPYENKSKVTLNSNQIIFTSINNVLQRLLDNDLYNEALLKQYIDEGKIAGPITITSIEEILNQYDENKKFILSDENGIQVIHKVHVPVSKTLKGRYLDGNKVNKVSFVNDSYIAATNTGYYVSDNKIDWKKEINKAGIDFVDVCYNKNYLIDDKSLLSSFDWIVLGNSANGTELFGHKWLSSGGKWVDFSTDSVLSGFNFSGKIGTHVFSFEKDTKFYVGTKNDGLWSIDGIVGHEPRRENGTNNWTINDFVEIKCDNDYERYFLATNYGVKQSRAIIGFDKLEKIHLFPKNTYVYEAIEKDGAIYAATSNGLAKIKDGVVSWFCDYCVYDILEYDGTIFAACGTNGIHKVEGSLFPTAATVSALKITEFNGDLFVVTAAKIPELRFIRYGKRVSKPVENFDIRNIVVRDLIPSRDVLYVVTNSGIKCVEQTEYNTTFIKNDNTAIGKIIFSKNISNEEVIIQLENNKTYLVEDVNERLSYFINIPVQIEDVVKGEENTYYFLADGKIYRVEFDNSSNVDVDLNSYIPGITSASKIEYINVFSGNSIIKGIAFIDNTTGVKLLVNGSTPKKINISTGFSDIAVNKNKLYGLYGTTVVPFESISEYSFVANEIDAPYNVENTVKEKIDRNLVIQNYNYVFDLSTTYTALCASNSEVKILNNCSGIDRTIAENQIKAVDYIGYALEKTLNDNTVLIAKEDGIKVYPANDQNAQPITVPLSNVSHFADWYSFGTDENLLLSAGGNFVVSGSSLLQKNLKHIFLKEKEVTGIKGAIPYEEQLYLLSNNAFLEYVKERSNIIFDSDEILGNTLNNLARISNDIVVCGSEDDAIFAYDCENEIESTERYFPSTVQKYFSYNIVDSTEKFLSDSIPALSNSSETYEVKELETRGYELSVHDFAKFSDTNYTVLSGNGLLKNQYNANALIQTFKEANIVQVNGISQPKDISYLYKDSSGKIIAENSQRKGYEVTIQENTSNVGVIFTEIQNYVPIDDDRLSDINLNETVHGISVYYGKTNTWESSTKTENSRSISENRISSYSLRVPKNNKLERTLNSITIPVSFTNNLNRRTNICSVDLDISLSSNKRTNISVETHISAYVNNTLAGTDKYLISSYQTSENLKHIKDYVNFAYSKDLNSDISVLVKCYLSNYNSTSSDVVISSNVKIDGTLNNVRINTIPVLKQKNGENWIYNGENIALTGYFYTLTNDNSKSLMLVKQSEADTPQFKLVTNSSIRRASKTKNYGFVYMKNTDLSVQEETSQTISGHTLIYNTVNNYKNDNFNDVFYYSIDEDSDGLLYVAPFSDKPKDILEFFKSSNNGNINGIKEAGNCLYVAKTNGIKFIQKNGFNYVRTVSGITSNIKRLETDGTKLYALDEQNDLFVVENGTNTNTIQNVKDVFSSNGEVYYVTTSNQMKKAEDGTVLFSGLNFGNSSYLAYLSSNDYYFSPYLVLKNGLYYRYLGYDFSTNYTLAKSFAPKEIKDIKTLPLGNEQYLFVAVDDRIFYEKLPIDSNSTFNNALTGFDEIKTFGFTSMNNLAVLDRSGLYYYTETIVDASDLTASQFLENRKLNIDYEDSNLSFKMSQRYPVDSEIQPLVIENSGTNCNYYIIDDCVSFKENQSQLTSFNSVSKFLHYDKDILYLLGSSSVYRFEDGQWTPNLVSRLIDENVFVAIKNFDFWTLSNSLPLNIKENVLSVYQSDLENPTGAFKARNSVYYYSNLSSGVYEAYSDYSYRNGGNEELSSQTNGKNVYGLAMLSEKDYVYNYVSSVTGIASAYSGNPSDTWTINANVSLFDSSDPALCAAVNLEYDTLEGTEFIKNYKNYVFFSNGGNGYAYNRNINEGFSINFDDLENLNGGTSRLLYLGNGYLTYGNLLASFDDFGTLIEFGPPSKEFSILASNFRNGTNVIEVVNDNPDFLIGSTFGLKYVYDKLITRSFYNRNDRSNSLNRNIATIDLVDKASNYYVASQENELYEITGLKTAKYDKLLTLSSDEVITSVFPFQKDEYLIATTKGIYTTEHKYTIRDDLHSITLSSVYKIINEELAKILSSHIENDHKEDSFITKLNKKADAKLSFLASTDKHVDVTNAELANAVKIVENDIIDTIVRGGEDPSKDTYVKVAVSNWATKAIKTESTYSSGGFVSKFVDPTSEKEFDISTVPYIVKNWKSGLKEIYVYVPTTATYYLNNPQGMSNSQYTYNSTQRKNVPDASVVNTLPNGATMLRVYLYNSYFGIKTILAAQCVGNSLPLKIYKDNVNADDSWKGFFDTVVQPSTLKTLPMTNDGNVNNVRVCTDDQGRIVLDFAVYGTDAQAIRIIAES